MSGGFFVLLFVISLATIFRFRYLFTVTEDRVMMRAGLIAKNTNEMQLRHIRAINVRQGVIERLLNIGTIEMMSAADTEAKVEFKGVSNPHRLKERIRGLKE
ncbi:MAG: PH domain-containing protein [Nitrospirota bacterium]